MDPRPWVRDFAPVVGTFAACPLVALSAGDAAASAVQRGRDLVDAERAAACSSSPRCTPGPRATKAS